MIMQPKILIGCPTYQAMEYCINEFIQRINEFTYPNYEAIIVDNSNEDIFYKKLKDLTKNTKIKILKDNCGLKDGMDKLIHSRNFIKDYFLNGDYDYLFTMDQDVIPPTNILEKLLQYNKEIITGVYFAYFLNKDKQIKCSPLLYKNLTNEEFQIFKEQNNIPENLTNKDFKRNVTIEELQDKELIEVDYCGNGCCLIKREVLEKISYSLIDSEIKKQYTSDDINIWEDARKKGYKIYADTQSICMHKLRGKYVNRSK